MSGYTSRLMAAALAATFAVGTVAPLNAAPVMAPVGSHNNSNVINVQQSRAVQEFTGRGSVNEWRRGDRQWRDRGEWRDRQFRRMAREDRRGFYRDNGGWYFNGHRGYRHHRPGWRRHQGFWFPPAAFVAGAIVGSALNADRGYYPRYRRYYGGDNWSAHVEWCYNRYRSYREWDNTYQPYNGPRRQCYSPYS